MLRDSHSYETQIIDAVRSVNKALGGTYGTSSAIYKSEFNQFEVQLIDAIKGIGRTLSGNGLSVSGGGGGASSAELQSLSARVSKLESESFFRLLDGNVTLKEQYQNLWVPGWLAAGGIGTGGGGGGGSSYLKELLDIYHNDSGILRGDGTAVSNGDVLVYDNTTDPTNPRWIAAAAGSGGVTVTNYGDITTGRIATVGSVDIYNGVEWGVAGSTENTFTLTINGTPKTVCLEGYESGGGGGAYALGTLTTDAATKGTMLGVNAISNDLASTGSESSLIVWDSTNSAWHFLGNIYSDGWISAVGTGSPGGGGGGGTDLATVWNSLTNTVSDIYADTKINIAHIPSITTSMVSDLETWVATKGYLRVGGAFTLRTPISNTAANGPLLGVDAISNAAGSTPGSDTSRIEWDGNNYAWHVYGNLYADGWVSAGGLGSAGSSISLDNLSDVTLTSPADGQFLMYDGTNGYWKNAALPVASASALGGIKVGSGLSIDSNGVLSSTGSGVSYLGQLQDVDVQETYAYDGYVLTYQHSTGNYILTAKSGGGGGGGSTVSWGTAYSDDTINLTVNGTTHRVCLYGYSSGGSGGATSLSGLSDVTISSPTSGQVLKYNGSKWVNGSAGGGTATSLSDLSDVSLSNLTDGQALVWDSANTIWKNASVGGGSVGGYIGTTAVQSSSQAQDLTGILSINATSSSSSLSRIVWDSAKSAWHLYGNLYADGWVAAGGTGSGSSGNVSFMLLTQTQYNSLATKESSTIYYVTSINSVKVYLGTIQLSN